MTPHLSVFEQASIAEREQTIKFWATLIATNLVQSQFDSDDRDDGITKRAIRLATNIYDSKIWLRHYFM